MGDLNRYKRLDPLSDPVFSCMFADESTMISMLEIINAVLTDAGDDPIERIVQINSQYDLIAESIGKKNGRLDVRAVAQSGELFDIEVQIRTMNTMNDRAWFYGSRLMSDSFNAGENYSEVPRVRVINLLDFVLRETHPDFLQPIGVMYKKEPPEVASDAFRIYNIELPKFRERYKTLESVKSDPLLRWLYLFEKAYKDEHEMEVLTDMSEGLRAFANKYNRSIDDPKLRRLYELDLSARMDEAEVRRTAEMIGMEAGLKKGMEKGLMEGMEKGLMEGMEKGLTEGRTEGRTEERTSLIRNMLTDGMPILSIYKYVDAPRREIDEIVAKLSTKDRL